MADGSLRPGTVIGGFESILPLPQAQIEEQIDATLSRKLPEAVGRKPLTVIANGPSARGWEPDGGETLALNGAIDLFHNTGRIPTYWAACDPQALVADFLPMSPPKDTIYLVASRCHPEVFDRLQDRDVRVWHPKERLLPGRRMIPRNCSVTLGALWLMFELGYTDFDVWGWDGCYGPRGEHHAGDQANGPDGVIDVNYGGRTKRIPVRQTLMERLHRKPKMETLEMSGGRDFSTSRTWVAEAVAAEQFFHLADYFNMSVNVRGDGMIKAAQNYVASVRGETPDRF